MKPRWDVDAIDVDQVSSRWERQGFVQDPLCVTNQEQHCELMAYGNQIKSGLNPDIIRMSALHVMFIRIKSG